MEQMENSQYPEDCDDPKAFRFKRRKRPTFQTVFTIALIGVLLSGTLTFADFPLNFGPFIACFLVATNLQLFYAFLSPPEWTCTLGPSAILWSTPEGHWSFAKTDLARILFSKSKRGKIEIIIAGKSSEVHLLPKEISGDTKGFQEAFSSLGYQYEDVSES